MKSFNARIKDPASFEDPGITAFEVPPSPFLETARPESVAKFYVDAAQKLSYFTVEFSIECEKKMAFTALSVFFFSLDLSALTSPKRESLRLRLRFGTG